MEKNSRVQKNFLNPGGACWKRSPNVFLYPQKYFQGYDDIGKFKIISKIFWNVNKYLYFCLAA